MGSVKETFTSRNWEHYKGHSANIKLTNLSEKRDDNLGVGEKIRKMQESIDFSLGIYLHRNLVRFVFGLYK